MIDSESQVNLERLIEELRAQVLAHAGRRGKLILVVQLDGDGHVTEESHLEPAWVYPVVTSRAVRPEQ